jgi:hypothetical protein
MPIHRTPAQVSVKVSGNICGLPKKRSYIYIHHTAPEDIYSSVQETWVEIRTPAENSVKTSGNICGLPEERDHAGPQDTCPQFQ